MTRPGRRARHQALAYLTLIYGASVALAVMLPSSSAAPVASGFLPIFVLLILSMIWGRAIWRDLGLRRSGLAYWPVAIAVPAGVAGLVYAIALAGGLVERESLLSSSLVFGLMLNVAVTVVFVLSEEIGWRGFLLPRINLSTSPRQAAVVTGLLHALVHLPLLVFTTTYNADGSRWLIAPVTIVTITAAGVLYAWLRVASGSIWPATLAHAMGNTLVGMITANAAGGSKDLNAHLVGEGGLVSALVMVTVAVVILMRARVWSERSGRAQNDSEDGAT